MVDGLDGSCRECLPKWFKSQIGQRPVPVKETHLTSAVFDQLRMAMSADPEGLTGLYRDYLADAWQSLQSLGESIKQGQVEEVRARAHYLKSSSLVLGAQGVARQAAVLEEAAAMQDLKNTAKPLAAARTALRKVQAELAERLGGGVHPADKTAA